MMKVRHAHVARSHLACPVPLVPCYCFGESDLYAQSKFGFAARRWLVKHLGIALTLPIGRSWVLPLLPRPGVKLVHCVHSARQNGARPPTW